MIVGLLDLLLGQKVRVLLVGGRDRGGFGPQFRGQVSVRGTEGEEDGHDVVTHGTGVTLGGTVTIFHAGHVHELLPGRRGNQTGTAGGGDQTYAHGTAFSGNLARDGVGETVLTSPVSATDGGDIEFGRSDGPADGVGNFRRTLDTHTDVTVGVPDGNKGLETGTLTSRRLLLDRHDLN